VTVSSVDHLRQCSNRCSIRLSHIFHDAFTLAHGWNRIAFMSARYSVHNELDGDSVSQDQGEQTMFTHDYAKATPPRRTGRPVALEAKMARRAVDRQASTAGGRQMRQRSMIRNAGAMLGTAQAMLRALVGRCRWGGLRGPLAE
jgi:hypothetical protein